MRRNRNSLLVLLLVLICVVLLVTGTFAAYTNVETIKRVVATRAGTNDLRFSSSYLTISAPGSYPVRLITVAEGSEVRIGVTVCNYSYGDLTLVSETPITYTLTARLVDSNGDPVTDNSVITYTASDGSTQKIQGSALWEKITIEGTSSSGGSYTATNTLPGGTSSQHLYRIICAAADYPILQAIAIQMEAVHGSDRLAGLFQVASATAQTAKWTGKFIDDADAFNYEIAGSAKGTLKLTWDSSLKITPWFEEDLKKQGYFSSSDNYSITFSVGNQNQPNHYRIQFYRVNGANRGNVTCNFIPDSSAS